MEMFKARNIWVVVLIGAAVFTIFVDKIGLEKLFLLINNANKPLVLFVILFNLLNLAAFTMTWRFLISTPISFYKLFRFYMIGAFINNVTPTFGTGGEPIKAMLLGKETGTSQAECFASVVSQRLLNMLPFLVISGLGIGLLFSKPGLVLGTWEILALMFSIGLSFGFFGLIIYFHIRKDKLSSFVRSSIGFFAPFIGLVKKGFNEDAYTEAVEKSINSFHGGLRNISLNKHGLVKAMLLSFLGWFFDLMAIYTVFVSLGANAYIHLSVLIIAYTISMVSSWLPLFLPGGLGIVDGTMVLLFIYGGVPVEIAMLATLLYRLASYWFNTILGAFYLLTSWSAR